MSGKEANDMTYADEEIKKNIIDQLYWNSRVNIAGIKVEVTDGKVTLTGDVHSNSAKAASSECAWLVSGVQEVDNNLKIVFKKFAEPVTDKDITNAIEQMLFWNADIVSTNIKVSVEHVLVTLSGTVPTFWEKMRAEQVVSRMSNITTVRNLLSVVPSKKFEDQKIAERIVSGLRQNSMINEDAIDVKVENGIVTISGIVPKRYTMMAVYNTAECTNGVTNVINNLTVT
jgi:osmotically-inducible protein OsmY